MTHHVHVYGVACLYSNVLRCIYIIVNNHLSLCINNYRLHCGIGI